MTIRPTRTVLSAATVAASVMCSPICAMPVAHADNERLNDSVAADVYTVMHQAGCTTDLTLDPKLQLAAQWHANDVRNDRGLDAVHGRPD